MIPMAKDVFSIEGLPYFRIQFIRDENNKITAILGMYQDGHTDKSEKTNM